MSPRGAVLSQNVDNDLKYWKGQALDIEVPDVTVDRLPDTANAVRPFSLQNQESQNFWEITLEQAIEYALKNAKVMKNIGGQVAGPADFLTRSLESAPTIYDPALVESNPRTGTEAALSAFDAQLQTSLTWEKQDTPENVASSFTSVFPNVNEADLGTFQARLQKTAGEGGTFALTHSVAYAKTNNPTQLYTSDWNVKLVAEVRQPLLQGAGTQFNRIAGPGATPGVLNGVMLAQINTNIAAGQLRGERAESRQRHGNRLLGVYFNYQRFGTARRRRRRPGDVAEDLQLVPARCPTRQRGRRSLDPQSVLHLPQRRRTNAQRLVCDGGEAAIPAGLGAPLTAG